MKNAETNVKKEFSLEKNCNRCDCCLLAKLFRLSVYQVESECKFLTDFMR